MKPAWFRQDMIALLRLLQQQKIKPLIAQRFPLWERGGVKGKIVLLRKPIE
jgi:NADPH2:quinone reductase